MTEQRIDFSHGGPVPQGPAGEREPGKMELKKAIGRRIRRVRKSRGLTQAEMVAHFGCGRANYSRIEKGEVFPNPTILRVLNERFCVSLRWLICDAGEMLEEQGASKPVLGLDLPAGDQEDIHDMLACMGAVPMVRHAMLGYFMEYKAKNGKIIAPLIAGPAREAIQ